jgi:hypothetical protein
MGAILCILGAISSYELRFGCFLACWTRMDEGYNTMVLHHNFEVIEKFTFSTPRMAKYGACTPPYYVLFTPLVYVYPQSSVTPTHMSKTTKSNKILPKLLVVQSSYENI